MCCHLSLDCSAHSHLRSTHSCQAFHDLKAGLIRALMGPRKTRVAGPSMLCITPERGQENRGSPVMGARTLQQAEDNLDAVAVVFTGINWSA